MGGGGATNFVTRVRAYYTVPLNPLSSGKWSSEPDLA